MNVRLAEAPHLFAIAVGSNRRHIRFGRPTGVVAEAIARLGAEFDLFDASPIMLSKAVGGAGRDFANSVALIECRLEPAAMLAALKDLEREFGRRRGRRWGPRVLDLDLVAWSGGRYRSRTLTIPHARLAERRFVLAPLAAIAPHWRVDGTSTATQLLARHGKRHLYRPDAFMAGDR